MKLQDFKVTLTQESAPAGLTPALEALWWAGKGDWERSHEITQETSLELDWVHAWLHRQEGDLSNAGYWYKRAQRTMPDESLEAEWDQIAIALLDSAEG